MQPYYALWPDPIARAAPLGAERSQTAREMLFQCPKLTPLQSRFAASFSALVLMGLIYWTLSHPQFAYAAELEFDGSGQSRSGGEDHNWHRIEQAALAEDGRSGDGKEAEGDVRVVTTGGSNNEELNNASSADGGHAAVQKRQASNSTISGNDSPVSLPIQPGGSTIWRYPNALLQEAPAGMGVGLPSEPVDKRDDVNLHAELRKRDGIEERQSDNTIYISINTCSQPTWQRADAQTEPPPQLTLSVSSEAVIPLEGGFANFSTSASGDVDITVSATSLPNGFSGEWAYELAVSRTAFYHAANLTSPFLYLADTDMQAALLVTDNTTQQNASDAVYQQWMALTPPPFIMFATHVNDTRIWGLENSICAWKNASLITANQSDPSGNNSHVGMSMITRGVGDKPKQQFYITDLNSSSSYTGVLALAGNSTASGQGVVGGGGQVWQPVNFTTKTDGNCALLFNLTFCSDIAYAVPTNATTTAGDLQLFYDNYTSDWYQNFNFSLQQIPCNTTNDAQYSLAKNCTMCAAAYKTWLCAVSVPRCDDLSKQPLWNSTLVENFNPNLQPRAVSYPFLNSSFLPDSYLTTSYEPMNQAPSLPGTVRWAAMYNTSYATMQSRNPQIDAVFQPGPYNELLPCEDLCYGILQACPAALGFGCPYPGRGLEQGYGQRDAGAALSCNWPGRVVNLNGAAGLMAPIRSALAFAAVAGFILMFM